MSEAFLKIVNMSISAGWLVLAVLALRLILKKAPKWVNVLLWGIVAVRLLCPISIESALSLIPSTQTISPEIMMDHTPEITTGIPALNSAINPIISDSFAPNPGDSANPLQILIPVAANIWFLGMLILLLYTAISYFSLCRKLRTATILRDNVYQCVAVDSPFVLGILRPKIYLPYQMEGQDLEHVVAHEQAHIRRKDHWWKPLGFLLLTVHWFNPLMWSAYILLCRDIELACDEKVIKEMGNEQRADYTQALVHCSINRRMIAACPLAFGEVGVKDRVRSIMNYRKPTFWIMVTAVVACVAVAVCFLTDPKPTPKFSMNGDNIRDLEPKRIVERIIDYQDIENSNVYMNANNFSLTVDANFDWVDSQAIRYFFYENHKVRSAQLRVFSDENEYFLTESDEWPDQDRIFLLRHYLDALKYLPQEAIRELAPADRYLIEHVDSGTPSDYERVITYSSEGVGETDGWYLHLRILPHHADGDAYSGSGEEAIHIFYGGIGLGVERSQLDQLQANSVVVSRIDLSSNLRSDVTITDQTIILKLLSMYKSVEVEDYSRPLNDERIMFKFFNGENLILDWYVSYYKEEAEVVTCGDAFGLGNKRVCGEFDYDWLLSLCDQTEMAFNGNLNLGLNAKIIDIDFDRRILYVKDLNPSAGVFGDRCAIDCTYAISRYNLMYVNYGDQNDVRTIDFSVFEIGDAIIIGMYDSELENAFNGSAVAEQIQLATQRLDPEEIVILQAKLLHIEDEHFIVEPVEGSPELNSASRIMVPMRNMAPSPEPVVGDILQIEYDGILQETYPARITNVYHISVTHRTGEAYEPAGCSGDQVIELSDTPDNMHWEDGLGFGELAPGEESVSDFEIRIDEDATPLILTITWARQSLVLEYGIRAEDGTEYSQEKRGGASILQISDIPAGVYHLFVRNCDVYHGIPSYEDPDKFKDVSFDATGALIYAFDQ